MPRFVASVPKRAVEAWPDAERPLPPVVRSYIESGAAEGQRNETIFKVAQQFHACGYSDTEAEGWIMPRAKADGVSDAESRQAIKSAFRSSKVIEPISLQSAPAPRTAKPDLEADFIRALKAAFEPDEGVAVVSSYRRDDGEWKPGKADIKTRREWERWHSKMNDINRFVGKTPGGAFMGINPLRPDAESRSNDAVTAFRHVLVEFDGPDDGSGKPEQRQKIEASGFPVSVMLDSGKRSVHAWVRVDATTREQWEERRDVVFKVLESDTKNKDLARVSRCPGAIRVIDGEERFQKLLAVRIGAKSWNEWEQRNAWTPKSWGVTELVENGPDAPPEVIKGLLRRSCVMQISSGPKMRKSFLLLDLALSIATGKPWLGMETVAGPVVYADAENQAALIRSRLPAVAEARGISLDAFLNDRVRFIPLRWQLRGKMLPEIVQGVTRSIRAMKEPPALAILEPLYLLLRGAKEKEAEEVTLALEELDELCNAIGCAIVFVHHFSKGSQTGKASMDKASGSGALSRFPDAILTLTPPDAPKKDSDPKPDWAATVEVDKRWFAPAKPFKVWWHGAHYEPQPATTYTVKQRTGSYADRFGGILELMPPLKRHAHDPQQCEVTAWLATRAKLELREAWNVFETLTRGEYSFATHLEDDCWCGSLYEAGEDEGAPF